MHVGSFGRSSPTKETKQSLAWTRTVIWILFFLVCFVFAFRTGWTLFFSLLRHRFYDSLRHEMSASFWNICRMTRNRFMTTLNGYLRDGCLEYRNCCWRLIFFTVFFFFLLLFFVALRYCGIWANFFALLECDRFLGTIPKDNPSEFSRFFSIEIELSSWTPTPFRIWRRFQNGLSFPSTP